MKWLPDGVAKFEPSGKVVQEAMPGREEWSRKAQVQEEVVDVASWQVVEGSLNVCHMADQGCRHCGLDLDECLQQHPDFLCFTARKEAKCASINLTANGA